MILSTMNQSSDPILAIGNNPVWAQSGETYGLLLLVAQMRERFAG